MSCVYPIRQSLVELSRFLFPACVRPLWMLYVSGPPLSVLHLNSLSARPYKLHMHERALSLRTEKRHDRAAVPS